jgi:hypothetical protein
MLIESTGPLGPDPCLRPTYVAGRGGYPADDPVFVK